MLKPETFNEPASDLASIGAGDTVPTDTGERLTVLYVNAHQDCDFAIAGDDDDVLYLAFTRIDPKWTAVGSLLPTDDNNVKTHRKLFNIMAHMVDADVPPDLAYRVVRRIMGI